MSQRVSEVDFLEAQLKQARIALETSQRLKQAAEEQRNAAVEQLRSVATALLATEWNLLRREQPDVTGWTPEQLGGWIIETARRKMNRLEILGGSGVDILESVARERDRWQAEAEHLHQEVERLARERDEYLSRLQVRDEENQRLRQELSQLRQRIADLSALSIQSRATAEISHESSWSSLDAEWLTQWRSSPDYTRDVEALRVIGQHGYVLRESVARVLGIDHRSGSTIRLFERLRETGLVEERTAPSMGARGRAPNLVVLTEKGRWAYQAIFGRDPVEPEDRRLLRRHKSEEQTMLALQARLILEEHGAEFVDLFPDPQPLPGGGVFEVDLISVLDEQKLFIELEIAPRGLRRLDKWDRYAQLTRMFYFFVPNRDALNRLMTELNYWSLRRKVAGVVVHVCPVSQVSADGGDLWQFIRALAGKT